MDEKEQDSNVENKQKRLTIIRNIRTASYFNTIALLTIINGFLLLSKTKLYFPAGITLVKVIVLLFFNHAVNTLQIYFALCLIFGAIYLIFAFVIKHRKDQQYKALYYLGIGFYIIDAISIIYLFVNYPNNTINYVIDVLFHGLLLYGLLRSFIKISIKKSKKQDNL